MLKELVILFFYSTELSSYTKNLKEMKNELVIENHNFFLGILSYVWIFLSVCVCAIV